MSSHTSVKDDVFAATVTNNNDGIKLFNFCRSIAPNLSKTDIRKCFVRGSINIDGIGIRPGHDDECRRLIEGQHIEIRRIASNVLAEKVDNIEADILFENPSFAIVLKAAGTPIRDFEEVIREKLWKDRDNNDNSGNKDTKLEFTLLYRPEKSLSGVCVVLRHQSYLHLFRSLLYEREVTVTYRCVVCGKVGEEGQHILVAQTTLSALVLKVSRSSRAEYLSYIEVTLDFSSGDMGSFQLEDDANCDTTKSASEDDLMLSFNSITDNNNKTVAFNTYPTRVIKGIRNVLFQAGYCVVGDRDMVKSGKGIFAFLHSVTLSSSACAQLRALDGTDTGGVGGSSKCPPSVTPTYKEPVSVHSALVISVPQEPLKIGKLLAREQQAWEAGRERERRAIAKATSSSSSSSKRTRSEISKEENEAHNIDNGDETHGKDCVMECSDNRNSIGQHDDAGCQRPSEYITGEAEFRGIRLAVNESVMIPRKSSETLVEQALRILTPQLSASFSSNAAGVRILDLGTGSGCLLLSVMHELQQQQRLQYVDDSIDCDRSSRSSSSSRIDPAGLKIAGVGVDISTDALQVAQANCRRLGLESRCSFVQGDFGDLSALTNPQQLQHPFFSCAAAFDGVFGSFDLLLCNPPYSSAKDISRLSTLRRLYEPSVALFAPEGGPLGCYRAIAKSLAMCEHSVLFAAGAHMVFEIGHGQCDKVKQIFDKLSFLVFMDQYRDANSMIRCLIYQYHGKT